MDSRTVSRQIRAEIWPVLKAAGFDEFLTRTAWRHSPRRIDVINFQSFNAYLAERVGCTPFSFSLNLGCFLTFVPSLSGRHIRVKNGQLLPEEYECHLRRRLLKAIRQSELKRADTWFIGSNGEQLVECIGDALTQIQSRGMPWFQRFDADEEILRTIADDNEGETFGIGAKDSPNRHALLGYAELSRNNAAAACEHLNLALKGLSKVGFSTTFEAVLRKTLQELKC